MVESWLRDRSSQLSIDPENEFRVTLLGVVGWRVVLRESQDAICSLVALVQKQKTPAGIIQRAFCFRSSDRRFICRLLSSTLHTQVELRRKVGSRGEDLRQPQASVG